jgi:hypothetical protein
MQAIEIAANHFPYQGNRRPRRLNNFHSERGERLQATLALAGHPRHACLQPFFAPCGTSWQKSSWRGFRNVGMPRFYTTVADRTAVANGVSKRS